ncbi:MAG: LysM peptidoglycan-binding domain-containing protein [Anaerolineae bacterium]|nr:LysM peptidoglycan-binding domain-containing protein [Anaerolineae bacterium]
MRKHRTRGLRLLGSIALMLLASGCFQQNGEEPDSLQVAQSGPTFTPPPTLTPETIIITSTPDPALEAMFGTGGSSINDQQVGLETDSGFSSSVEVAQVQDDIDPLFITATYIVAQATVQAAFDMTATAAAAGIGFPTATSFFPTSTPFASTAAPVGACTHVVVQGENLFRIALQYNVTLDSLAQANSIANPALILIGQQLNIPGCGAGGGVVTNPIPGTTVEGGAIAPGTTYTVQQGDTLFKISLRSGIPVMSIAAANATITDINVIVVNQQIFIPNS